MRCPFLSPGFLCDGLLCRLRRVPPAAFAGNCHDRSIRYALPSFVQPAVAQRFGLEPAGILPARRGLYLRLDHGFATQETGGSHDEIGNQARNAGTVFGGSDRSAAIRSGLCRGRRRRSTFGQPRHRRTPGPLPGRAPNPRRSPPNSRAPRRCCVPAGIPGRACDDLRAQRLCRRHRAANGARPRRQCRRRQPDRLFLSQARRLQAVADLVRARAEGGPEPRVDLAVLRPVADRAGQSRPGVVPSRAASRRFAARAARSIGRWPRRSKSRPAPDWFIERCDEAGRARLATRSRKAESLN